MNRTTRKLVLLSFLSAGLLSSGCAGLAQSLGLAPPQNRLTEQTKQVLQSAHGPAELPKELAKALLPEFVVEPGDTLLVVPVDLDSPVRLPGDQTVLQDGTIELGAYGRPLVAGKTVAVIEQEINALVESQARKLHPPQDAQDANDPNNHTAVTVRLVGRVSKVFYVLGEVNSPGAYPISGRETVLDGILAGGGISSRASTKKIVLSRPTPPHGCRMTFPICYDNIVQLGDTSTNYQLMPGDRIFVGSSGFLDALKDFNNKKKACGPCDTPQFSCESGSPVGCANGNCTGSPTVSHPVSVPAVLPTPTPTPTPTMPLPSPMVKP